MSMSTHTDNQYSAFCITLPIPVYNGTNEHPRPWLLYIYIHSVVLRTLMRQTRVGKLP